MRTLAGITLITVTAALLGCTADTTDAPADASTDPAPSTRERLLAGPVTLPAVPSESVVTVGVRLPQEEAVATPTALEASGGEAVVLASPQELVLESLRLPLEDGVVSASRLPPHGLTLTGIEIRTDGPAAGYVRWFGDGDEGYAELEADLLLDWSLVPPGHPERDPWPLEQQRIEKVVFDVHVTTDRHGNLTAEITGDAQGLLWSWGEIVELRDARIQVLAIETEDGR